MPCCRKEYFSRMNKKYDIVRFILKCILIPAAAVFVIYALNIPYRKIDAGKYMDIIKFDILGHSDEVIQIANVGSSHGAYGLLYDDISDMGYSCFNFANVSQSFDYDLAMLKEFQDHMQEGSVLFIPISYFSFNNEVINSKEAEAMSIRYYHFLSPENIPDYDLYVDIITHKLPVLSAGEDILELLPDLNTVLTAHAAGSGIDEEEIARRAQERYSRHFDNKEEYFMPERIEELYEIIDFCKERNITPVLITTPFTKYYIDLVPQNFLEEFYTTINRIADDTGVSYYDYSHDSRFYDNLEPFSDSDHLTEDGALYFTDILWDEVTELERFH